MTDPKIIIGKGDVQTLLFSEQFVDNGNISNKNIEVVKDTDPKVLGFYWD